MNDSRIYHIPARFRRVENLHILLWLIKDICWALNFKPLGVFMIFPTLTVAILITWQTRHVLSELLHNLAVDLWITANCTWMIGEFFGWEQDLVGTYGLRQFSLIPFSIGLAILFYYYLVLAPRKSFRDRMALKSKELIREEVTHHPAP